MLLLGGSWVLRSRGISRVIPVLTSFRVLITLNPKTQYKK